MTQHRMRVPALAALLFLAGGCSDDTNASTEIEAFGSIQAFGWAEETSLLAHYSSELDDEACELRDAAAECVVLRCQDETQSFEDAGEVAVRGETLEIAEDNSYALVVSGELVPGEELEMRAAGSSAVPKHAGTVVVPERAELTSELDFPVVDPTMDFVVTWTPVASDRAIFRATFATYQIECATTGAAGQITVASRLLSGVPSELPGVFSLTNENLVEKSVSKWRLWFRAHQVIADGAIEIAPRP